MKALIMTRNNGLEAGDDMQALAVQQLRQAISFGLGATQRAAEPISRLFERAAEILEEYDACADGDGPWH